MEKLTIEQKAKAYDEALKVLHKYDGANIMFSQSLKEEMFPELKESEGERIRREIITYLSTVGDKELIPYESWIAWLEKQGKQTSLQTNERAWLHLVADVLTWKDGIGQYLDDPRVQELAKKLRSEYAQKLYNSVQDAPNEQKTIERKDFISIPFGTDSELIEETITIPDGCVATIEGNKIHIKRKGKSATDI